MGRFSEDQRALATRVAKAFLSVAKISLSIIACIAVGFVVGHPIIFGVLSVPLAISLQVLNAVNLALLHRECYESVFLFTVTSDFLSKLRESC
jgi:hypothetical protein